MRRIEANFQEVYLLPPSVEDWLPSGHPARFIREVVERLDMGGMGFRSQEAEEGRPPYANELLLRVWLYGYFRKIRSSRKLEEACQQDMGFIWLSGNHRPDHNTLWRFFRENRKGLREVFKKTVRVALELKLVGMVLEALDGSKIQAACSGYGRHHREDLERLLGKLDQELERWERAIEGQQESAPVAMPEELASRQRLRQKVAEALELAQSQDRRHVHPQEPESRRMECEGRNRFAYNAQAVVDAREQVIVAADVSVEENDMHQLEPMTQKVQENLGCVPPLVADGGYASGPQLKEMEDQGIDVLTPIPGRIANQDNNPYHSSCFEYDGSTDEFLCPEGRRIPFQRVRLKGGHEIRVYRSAQTCQGCPALGICTRDRHGRTVEWSPGSEAIGRLKKRLEDPVNQERLRRRGAIVEMVFAQIKQQGGFRRWSMRGLENAKTQWALLCATWNLRVIWRYWRSRPLDFAAMLSVPKVLSAFLITPMAMRVKQGNRSTTFMLSDSPLSYCIA